MKLTQRDGLRHARRHQRPSFRIRLLRRAAAVNIFHDRFKLAVALAYPLRTLTRAAIKNLRRDVHMRNDDRKKLLADYAVALVAERESWERLHEPHLTEAERCRILGEWKQVAAGLKMLVRQLRAAPAAPVFHAPSAQFAGEGALVVPNPPVHAQVEPAAVHAPAAADADVLRRPFHGPVLVTALRLITLWRARLGTAMPGTGVHLMRHLRWPGHIGSDA